MFKKLFNIFADAFNYAESLQGKGKVKCQWFHAIQKWMVWVVSIVIVVLIIKL